MSAFGYRIQSVTTDIDRRAVVMTWDDGSLTTKYMGPLIAGKRVFKPLADPALFATVAVINNGRALAWGDDIDLCADALWYEAHPEQNPFTPLQETA